MEIKLLINLIFYNKISISIDDYDLDIIKNKIFLKNKNSTLFQLYFINDKKLINGKQIINSSEINLKLLDISNLDKNKKIYLKTDKFYFNLYKLWIDELKLTKNENSNKNLFEIINIFYKKYIIVEDLFEKIYYLDKEIESLEINNRKIINQEKNNYIIEIYKNKTVDNNKDSIFLSELTQEDLHDDMTFTGNKLINLKKI